MTAVCHERPGGLHGLQLAVLRGGDLLTADSALAQAAQRAGITVQGAELSP
jgi:hypothetical protein